jgi:hypothetical protein
MFTWGPCHTARPAPRRPTCTFLPRHGRSGADGVDAISSRAPFLVLRPSFPRFFTTEKSPERARLRLKLQALKRLRLYNQYPKH